MCTCAPFHAQSECNACIVECELNKNRPESRRECGAREQLCIAVTFYQYQFIENDEWNSCISLSAIIKIMRKKTRKKIVNERACHLIAISSIAASFASSFIQWYGNMFFLECVTCNLPRCSYQIIDYDRTHVESINTRHEIVVVVVFHANPHTRGSGVFCAHHKSLNVCALTFRVVTNDDWLIWINGFAVNQVQGWKKGKSKN